MALSACNVITNKYQKETVSHGMTMFPIACYDDDFVTMNVPWHWHNEFECILMTEGNTQIHIENQVILLKQGDALFINSAILHSIDKTQESPCKCHSLVFHAHLLGGSIESIFWSKLISPLTQNSAFHYLYLCPSIEWQQSVITQMSAAWQAVVDESEDFENEVRYSLSKSFYQIVSHLEPINEIKPNMQDQLNAERIKTMICFIEENYQNEISLEMIALSASISKSACLRCFRQMINTTPIRYLMQYRIEKAAETLQNTKRQINEIATDCGFSDISYFSKCFREIKGCQPLEYRKASRHNAFY